MSSAYPPGGRQTLPCQRCRAPLPVDEPLCYNCGFNNAPSSVQFGLASPPPAKNAFGSPSLSGSPVGSERQPSQQPPTPDAFPSQPQMGDPSARRLPSGARPQATPSRVPQVRPTHQAYTQPPDAPTQRSYAPFRMPASAPIAQQPYASRASDSLLPQSYEPPAGPSASPLDQTNSAEMASGLTLKEPAHRRRPWLIVGIVVLLLLLIGGGTAGYLYLNGNLGTQATRMFSNTTNQPMGATLFADTFSNNKSGWSLQSYPGKFSASIAGGSLVLENDNNELMWEPLPGNQQYGDCVLTVDTLLSRGDQNNGYGIAIRGASTQNADLAMYYRFELYGDGSYAIFKGTVGANGTVASTKLVDYTLQPAIAKQGNLNHVMISATGSTMSLTVNGQKLKTITDTSYRSGSIALFVSNLQNAKAGAQAKFSNLHIYAV